MSQNDLCAMPRSLFVSRMQVSGSARGCLFKSSTCVPKVYWMLRWLMESVFRSLLVLGEYHFVTHLLVNLVEDSFKVFAVVFVEHDDP